MSTPYIGFGNDTLGKMPLVAIGEPIICPLCTQVHKLKGDDNGGDLLMFYRCGNKTYLGAVSRRLVAGIKPDVSGKV